MPGQPIPSKPMIVAGVMSGTSADGVDVALCRICMGADSGPNLKLLGHAAFPYPAAVRKAALAAMDAPAVSVAEVSRLHWRLDTLYAGPQTQLSAATIPKR